MTFSLLVRAQNNIAMYFTMSFMIVLNLDRYVPLVCNVGALDIIEAEHVSGEGTENGAKQARKLDERRRT